MLHAVSNVVSTLIACGMCLCFTIMAILGMLHDGTTACELCGVLTEIVYQLCFLLTFLASLTLTHYSQMLLLQSPVLVCIFLP